jgi:hypothetical protein
MPALPLDEAGKYVAAAYLVFLALLLIYVSIMATRLSRFEREIGELAELAKRRVSGATPPPPDRPGDAPGGQVAAAVGEEPS